MRARYGTGVFLKLNKRDCGTRIRLTPLGGDFLRVHWKIGGDNHYFFPSCVMGSQFSAFIEAVFRLYEEKDIDHIFCGKLYGFEYDGPWNRYDNMYRIRTTVHWDEEGRTEDITFIRICKDVNPCPLGTPDPIEVHIVAHNGKFNYVVDGRDLCYAIAKACTEAWKKYGFLGYYDSTGMQYPGDNFCLADLLFIKAYALNTLSVREKNKLWESPHGWNPRAYATSFENEIELLLFDM